MIEKIVKKKVNKGKDTPINMTILKKDKNLKVINTEQETINEEAANTKEVIKNTVEDIDNKVEDINKKIEDINIDKTITNFDENNKNNNEVNDHLRNHKNISNSKELFEKNKKIEYKNSEEIKSSKGEPIFIKKINDFTDKGISTLRIGINNETKDLPKGPYRVIIELYDMDDNCKGIDFKYFNDKKQYAMEKSNKSRGSYSSNGRPDRNKRSYSSNDRYDKNKRDYSSNDRYDKNKRDYSSNDRYDKNKRDYSSNDKYDKKKKKYSSNDKKRNKKPF